MKINIITQPLFCNYGGILQNYALQETLRRMGHEVTTINVPPRKIASRPDWKAYVHSLINLVKKVKGLYDHPFLNPHTFAWKERELSGPQRAFVSKYIHKIDCPAPFSATTASANTADLWIVGSDQVWRPWCSPCIENYFFDFLDANTPRIAYAASFGVDKWEISPELTLKLRELAKHFKAISVREASGVTLCKEYLGKEAFHVLDPTMLLGDEDYLSLTTESDFPKGQYIATYVLDSNPAKKRAVNEDADKYDLTVVRIGQMHRDHFDSIESWLATIAHAERVITDSFHGTVFSIIFGRPVKILQNDIRGNSRLDSLTTMLELKMSSDGYYYPSKDVAERILELKKSSMIFLQNALS